MTNDILDEKSQQAIEEKSRIITDLAIGNINALITSRQDINVFDIMEYLKLSNIYGAKVISKGALKGDKHPNVRTVLTDVHEATMVMRDELEAINPELADDFEWPDEEPVEAPAEEPKEEEVKEE